MNKSSIEKTKLLVSLVFPNIFTNVAILIHIGKKSLGILNKGFESLYNSKHGNKIF